MLLTTVYNITHHQISSSLMEQNGVNSVVANEVAWWIMDNLQDELFTDDFINQFVTFDTELLLHLYDNILSFDNQTVYFKDIPYENKIHLAINYLKNNFPTIYTMGQNGYEYWTIYVRH